MCAKSLASIAPNKVRFRYFAFGRFLYSWKGVAARYQSKPLEFRCSLSDDNCQSYSLR